MTEALDEVKNDLLALCGKLYDEERILCQDLNGIVDQDEIDRHLDPISLEVDATIKSYYLTLRTMHINFEDLSMRSLRQMAQNAKLLETLVQARDIISVLLRNVHSQDPIFVHHNFWVLALSNIFENTF